MFKMTNCPSFIEAVSYSLASLGMPGLDLKEEQELAIRAVYDKKDVFVWLPTGFGKSVCFQTLPFLFDCKLGLVGSSRNSVVLVVVPLVALMIGTSSNLPILEAKFLSLPDMAINRAAAFLVGTTSLHSLHSL